MKRLNVTLPEEIAQEIKDVPNKSHFIAQAVKEKLERINKEKLDRLLMEGYKATKKEDEKINEEWEAVTLEEWK